jgi:UDP-glucose 4-epimerase
MCKALHDESMDFIVLDNLSNGHKDFVRWSDFIEGDMGDKELLRKIFKAFPISTVMHFAAYAYVGESVLEPRKYYDNNLANSLTLLNTMCEFDIKNIIFSSTCATYGHPDRIPIDETHEQRPINPYGSSKYMIETILRDYDHAYGIKSVVFRYFNAAGADVDAVIGERHHPETHLIPLVLQTATGQRDAITIFGDDYATRDGTCIRDYIHVQDLADAHLLGMDYLSRTHNSAAFNLGNGHGFTIREVIQAAESVTGKKIKYDIGPRRAGDPPELVGSSQKAMQKLGWDPKLHQLETIIDTAWQWHRRDWQS